MCRTVTFTGTLADSILLSIYQTVYRTAPDMATRVVVISRIENEPDTPDNKSDRNRTTARTRSATKPDNNQTTTGHYRTHGSGT